MVDVDNKDDLIEHFKSEFEDFQPAVDNRVWENIKKELHPEKNEKFIWWQWAAAASLLLGLSYMGIEQMSKTEEAILVEKSVEVKESGPANEASGSIEPPKHNSMGKAGDNENPNSLAITEELSSNATTITEMKKMNDPVVAANSKNSTQMLINADNPAIESLKQAIVNEEIKFSSPQINELMGSESISIDTDAFVLISQVEIMIESIDTSAATAADEDSPVLLTEQELTELLQKQSKEEIIEPLPKPSEEKWILAANLLSMSAGTGAFALAGVESMDKSSGGQSSGISTNSFQFSSSSQSEYGEITYLPPIVTSVTANYQISKRWSVESGLAYSLLLSNRETPEVNGERDVLNVRMNYLGIPVLLKFDIVSNRKLVFYSNAGGMIDMGLKGKYTTTAMKDGNAISESDKRYNISGANLSASMGMGLDYKINKLLSYYLQPGITVQFIGDGYIYNIRNNKILWPNITTGLRFHINEGKKP